MHIINEYNVLVGSQKYIMVTQLATPLPTYKQGMLVQQIDTPTRRYKAGQYVKIKLRIYTYIP